MDKHKLWFIIGIVLAAALIGFFLFSAYGPGRQALFGKAILAGTPLSSGTQSLALNCMNIQLLPFTAPTRTVGSAQDFWDTYARQAVCQSAGCTFSGWEGDPLTVSPVTYKPSNDVCSGTVARCPDVTQYPPDFLAGNDARKAVCQSAGCVFTDGGDTSFTGDLCTAPPETCDGKDNDLDRLVDEGLTRPAANTVGVCQGLQAVCKNGVWEEPNLAFIEGYQSPETACTDQIDNDCDGLEDGADTDCAAAPEPVLAQPAPACGNTIVEGTELCDDGNLVTETACPYGTGRCVACPADCSGELRLIGPFCGDGTVNGPETCDDGNTAAGDGCSATCAVEGTEPLAGISPTLGTVTQSTTLADTTLTALTSKISTLGSSVGVVKLADEADDAYLDRISAQVAVKDSELAAKKAEADAFKSQLVGGGSDNVFAASLQTQLTQKAGEVEAVKSAKAAVESDLTAKATELTKVAAEKDAVTAEKNLLAKEKAAVESSLDTLQQDKAALEAQYNLVIIDSTAAYKTLQGSYTEKEAALSTVEAEKASLSAQLRTEMAAKSAVQNNLLATQRSLSTVEANKDAVTADLAAERVEKARISTSLADAQKAKALVDTELVTTKENLNLKTSEVTEKVTEIASLKNVNTDLLQDKNALSSQISVVQKNYAALDTQYKTLSADATAAYKTLQSAHDLKVSEAASLAKEKTDLTSSLDLATSLKASLENSVVEKDTQLSQEKLKVADLKKNIAVVEVEKNTHKSAAEGCTLESKGKDDELTKLRGELAKERNKKNGDKSGGGCVEMNELMDVILGWKNDVGVCVES